MKKKGERKQTAEEVFGGPATCGGCQGNLLLGTGKTLYCPNCRTWFQDKGGR